MTLVDTQINPIQALILKHLLVDGRKSCTKIAQESNLLKTVIYENFNQLKQEGIINGATIHINYKSFGYKAVANLLVIVDPAQSDPLVEYVRKIPGIYSAFKIGPGGNIRILATLEKLQQLSEIKDSIKQRFSTSDMKTVIWTDVKEMHQNLNLSNQKPTTTNLTDPKDPKKETKIISETKSKFVINKNDLKLAEILSTNGRIALSLAAKQMGVSLNSVIKRYQILKDNKVLKVTIQIDPLKIGYRAMVIFFVAFTIKADSSSIINQISQIPDIISIMKTSGDYDLQIYAMVRNIEQLLSIQEEFTKISGIAKMDIDLSRILNKWPTPRQYISTF